MAIEYIARHEMRSDCLALLQCETEIRDLLRIDLAEVNLAVLLGDEADKVSPVSGHRDEGSPGSENLR